MVRSWTRCSEPSRASRTSVESASSSSYGSRQLCSRGKRTGGMMAGLAGEVSRHRMAVPPGQVDEELVGLGGPDQVAEEPGAERDIELGAGGWARRRLGGRA